MHTSTFSCLLQAHPIIAAVKDEAGLEECLKSDLRVVFVLYGSIVDISEITERIAHADKAAVVHIDLVDGLAAREVAADFIRQRTSAAGIISTKSVLIKRAMQLGLIAVQRFFLLDSMALANIRKQTRAGAPDMIEVIPGAMPKEIRKLADDIALPIIAGGLIRDAEDVTSALNAGAKAISSTNPALWRQFTAR